MSLSWSVRALYAGALCAAAAWGADDTATYRALLAQVRARIGEEAQRRPNYTCTELITRSSYDGNPPTLRRRDRVRLDVAYVGKNELFAWPGDPFRHTDPARLIPEGLSGSGDFANFFFSIFLSDMVSYESARRDIFAGRNAVRFEYKVTEPLYRLKFNDVVAHVAFHGSFWIDAGTERLLGVEIVADDIPKGLRVSAVRVRIELKPVSIGGSQVNLPRSTVLTLIPLPARGQTNRANTNQTEFANCREYTAESTIRFEEAPESATPALKAAPPELPRFVKVRTALNDPIEASTSAAGDELSATVLEPARAGSLRIPKGARLIGRVLRLHIDLENRAVTATVEFSEIEIAGARLDFPCRLKYARWPQAGSAGRPPGLNEFTFRPRGYHAGPATFDMRNGLLAVPAGLEMVWETADRKTGRAEEHASR